jgi:hypothetical protein
MVLPDYTGGSIVNLMASLEQSRGGAARIYPPHPVLPPEDLAGTGKLILLVVDGLGYEYLTREGRGSALHHHLRGRMTSVCPATTASAISTFLTGTAPQQHGFTGWFTWFRELGSVLAVLPFRARYGGEPLGGLGINPASLCGATPVFGRIGVDSHIVMPDWIAGSDFNLAFQGGARVWPYNGMEGLFHSIRSALQEPYERSYVYAYWPDFDALAHAHGVASGEVARHFDHFDRAFADFVRTLKESGATLVVTSDHGFIDVSPERTILLDDHPPLADTLVLPLCGESRLAYCYVHPDRRQAFEAYVGNELTRYLELHPSSELIAQGWFGLGEPYPPLLDRVGHYALVMKENYRIKDWVIGEKPYQYLGAHGGVSEQEMYVPLIVVEN